MTSITRKILRSNPNYEQPVRTQVTEDLDCGGYKTLSPTGGWKYFSAKRIKAMETMMQKYGFIR